MPTQTYGRFGTFLTACAVVALIATLALTGLSVPHASALLRQGDDFPGPGDVDDDLPWPDDPDDPPRPDEPGGGPCGVSIEYFHPFNSTIDAGQSTTLVWLVQVTGDCLVLVDLAVNNGGGVGVPLTDYKTIQPYTTTTYGLIATVLPQLSTVSATTTVTVHDPGRELAFHHAPIHHQDTDNSYAEADFLTRFDYDGNMVATDNWEHLHTLLADRGGAVYYSVVESCTHWFIMYAMFHPQDWSDHPFDQEHENDMEGLLAIVGKDGSPYGRLEGIVTVFHTDFLSYTPPGSLLATSGGVLQMQADPDDPTIVRPLTFQEAKGHGLTALPPAWQNFPGGDGVIYFPGGLGEVPTSGNDRDVQYELIDFFAPNGLWERQLQEAGGGQTFATWGTLRGDKGGGCGGEWNDTVVCAEDAASPPWGWDDTQYPVFRGAMALHPAELVNYYFNGAYVSDIYLRHPYLKRLRDLRNQHGPYWKPAGWPSQVDLGMLLSKLRTSCFDTPLPPDDAPPDDPPPPPPACPENSDPKNCYEL